MSYSERFKKVEANTRSSLEDGRVATARSKVVDKFLLQVKIDVVPLSDFFGK